MLVKHIRRYFSSPLKRVEQVSFAVRLLPALAVLMLSVNTMAQDAKQQQQQQQQQQQPLAKHLPSKNTEQGTEKSTLTLASAIQRALKENPAFKVFTLRQVSLDGQQQTQALAPAYQLGFEAENFAGSGQLKGFDGAEFTVSLSSVIEMGDKRAARRDLGIHRSAQLTAERKIAALSLLAEVTRRYIDVLTAQASLSLADEATLLAEETLVEVEKRAKAGSTPKAEIKRALAAVGNARLGLSAKQQQLSYSKLSLALLWNESLVDFNQVTGDLYYFSDDVAFEQLYAKVKQNPALLAFASEERLKSAQLRLAKSQSSIDIQWTIGVKQLQDIGDTALVAGFSVPLFNSTNNSGAIITAQAERDEVQARKVTALLNLHSQLQQAYYSRKQAIYTANSLRHTIIPLLEEALAETKIAYQRGLYSYLDYLSARQELLIAKRALIKSASAALCFGADIEQLIAEPLPASQHVSYENNRFTQG
jgi:cobalt-zinc-cadmium efflux system outer membrane protein